MATRLFTKTVIYPGVWVIEWTGLLNGDIGQYLEAPDFAEKLVEFSGIFGVGGTVVIEGANGAAAPQTLNNSQGKALSKTMAAIETILENPLMIRPRVTAGDGSTSLTVRILLRSGLIGRQ